METVKKQTKTKGRPQKLVKKEIRAAVRFTKVEYFVVQAKAKKAGLLVSGYLRQLAIHGKITPRLNEEERQSVRLLIGMASNINQVARVCHQEGSLKAVLYFEQYRQQIDDILNRLRA